MDTMHESKVEKATLVSAKVNLDTYLHLAEDAMKAMFGWQHEVLKFADMRVAANMKLVSDVAEAKEAGEFSRVLVEHVSIMYAQILNTAVSYSQRVQDILRVGSKDTPERAPTTVREYAKQSTGSKQRHHRPPQGGDAQSPQPAGDDHQLLRRR